MIEVESGSVEVMRDETQAGVLNELNEAAAKISIGIASLLIGLPISAFLFLISPTAALVALGVTCAAWLFGAWLDGYRRAAVVFYEFDEDARKLYEKITVSIDTLTACAGKWHIHAGGQVTDLTTWKRNAGATRLVRKNPTEVTYKLPSVLRCNITPPAIAAGKQTLYFLPDGLLVEANGKFGTVAYSNIRFRWQDSNFIEEGSVPADAEVIRMTWQHPNKSGGPDRRFKNNRQIPVCRYEVLHLQSDSGLNELVEFSRTGVSAGFVEALKSVVPRDSSHCRSAAAERKLLT